MGTWGRCQACTNLSPYYARKKMTITPITQPILCNSGEVWEYFALWSDPPCRVLDLVSLYNTLAAGGGFFFVSHAFKLYPCKYVTYKNAPKSRLLSNFLQASTWEMINTVKSIHMSVIFRVCRSRSTRIIINIIISLLEIRATFYNMCVYVCSFDTQYCEMVL